MDYKCVPFEPAIDRKDPVSGVAASLDSVISTEAKAGWEFVGLENHSTVVPGSNGCFGFGATSPFEKTFSVAVFRK
ncbi:hypothetical protein [Phaeobacter gallaeciensis]|uniref:hypothetical protein n=1 Tax=Phaeobacter gallaeciensis TaxID=60890 RepID=UPI00237F2E76|nr:hypothetical protein [Phaeobacter gallaeciensis]MDE4063244.1 hypothetical protein [Phaeobacter gallaeciensis]MDE4126266.1 hypothetical protein [Phaeobacter gallaeciensis]MDE4130684.1 hypothetical protein [Phaeobacter gallaeciensis]